MNMKKHLIAALALTALCASALALEKPYVWENLTSDDFKAAVSNSQGVVVVPIGCVEMHNHHLPIGTDYFAGIDIARKALTQEEAVLFTMGLFGAVREARHQPGAMAISSNTLRALLEDMCDEFARNGLNDIILFNTHGGNTMFIEEFVRSRLDRPHPYRVYYYNDTFLGPQYREWYAKFGKPEGPWGHACIMETSLMLALRPELVYMDRANVEEAIPLTRLAPFGKLKVKTSFDWYGEAPNQAYGDPTKATKAFGDWVVDTACSNLVNVIRAVKADKVLPQLQREFYDRSLRPVR